MDSKFLIAHIATEVVIIGGVSFYFHKRIAELNLKIAALEKKLEKCEKDGVIPSGGVTSEQFNQLSEQTSKHINNIYSAIRQLADNTSQPMRKPSPFPPQPQKRSSPPPQVFKPRQPTPAKVETIEEEKEEVCDEDLDNELEDELKDLDDLPHLKLLLSALLPKVV